MTKNYTPLELVEVITKTIKAELVKHANDSTVSSASVEEKASVASLTKPTELIHESHLTGQEPSHADAVDHHATLSVAHFHSGHDQLAKTHQELAVAHGNKIGVDALVFLKSVYGQFEDMEIPVAETFIPHEMDKALEKKESAPAIECVKLVSGEGVDKQHIGTTPDDKKSKLLNDPSKDKVKKDEPKEDSEESTTDEKDLEKCGKVCKKSESWENAERANLSMMAHQIGLFEPIMKASVGPALPKAPVAPAAPQMPKMPPMPAGPKAPSAPIAKEFDFASKGEFEETSESTTDEKDLDKAGARPFKSKQIADIKQKRLIPTNKAEDHEWKPGDKAICHSSLLAGGPSHEVTIREVGGAGNILVDHPKHPGGPVQVERKHLSRPTNKDEVSVDQELQGKGRPENNEDRGNAVLNKDKK